MRRWGTWSTVASVGSHFNRGARALGVQLCPALAYLHRNRVPHLDLTPSNVICQADQAKLIDLRIARPPGRCRAGVGTPACKAPEQVRGGDLAEATDV